MQTSVIQGLSEGSWTHDAETGSAEPPSPGGEGGPGTEELRPDGFRQHCSTGRAELTQGEGPSNFKDGCFHALYFFGLIELTVIPPCLFLPPSQG